jgi:hypothetical protein
VEVVQILGRFDIVRKVLRRPVAASARSHDGIEAELAHLHGDFNRGLLQVCLRGRKKGREGNKNDRESRQTARERTHPSHCESKFLHQRIFCERTREKRKNEKR